MVGGYDRHRTGPDHRQPCPELVLLAADHQQISLEPGDRILLYSDGVVESRDEAGEEFGLERFTDYIIRSTAAGQSAPEVLRLLIHAILEHRHDKLSDDATILMFEWQPPEP